MDKIKASAGTTVAQVAAQNGVDEPALRAVNDINDGTDQFSSETELVVPEKQDVENANENVLSAALRERVWKLLKGKSKTAENVLWGEAFGKGLKIQVAQEAAGYFSSTSAQDKLKTQQATRGNDVEWIRTSGLLSFDSGDLGGARDPTFSETAAFRTTTGLTVKGGVTYELDRAFVYRKGRKEPLRLAQEMAKNNTVGLPLTAGLASDVEQGGRFKLIANASLDASTKREITDGETDREAKLKLAASGKIESVFEWTEPNKLEVTVTTSHDVEADAEGSTSDRGKGTSAAANLKAKTQRTRQQLFKIDLTTEAGKKAYDLLIQQRRGAAAKLAAGGAEGVSVEEKDPAGLAKLDEVSGGASFTGTRSDGEFKARMLAERSGTTDKLRNELFAKLFAWE